MRKMTLFVLVAVIVFTLSAVAGQPRKDDSPLRDAEIRGLCPRITYTGFACFGLGGNEFTDCHRLRQVVDCDGDVSVTWSDATYYTYLSDEPNWCGYVNGDYVMVHETSGVPDQWFIFGLEDTNVLLDFSGLAGWRLAGRVSGCEVR